MTVLELLGLVLFFYQVGLALDRARAWPDRWRLAEAPPRDPGAPSPEVVVMIPARDEAEALPEALPSVLAQDYPNLRVVLVDDHSADGTGEERRRRFPSLLH